MLKKFLLIVCMFINQFLVTKDLSDVDRIRTILLRNEIQNWINFPYEYEKRARLFFVTANLAINRGKIDLAENLFELGLSEIN